MATSKAAQRKKSQRRVYVAFTLMVIITIGVYLLYFTPGPPVAVSFSFQMSIQISNGTSVRFIGYSTPVGIVGWPWNNHTYDGQGPVIDGVSHYPVYSDQPPNPYPGFTIIHVASTVNRLYYLSDYFSVWGKPLGSANTIGISSNSTFLWQMCTGTPPGEQLGHWGAEVLVPNLEVTLVYYNPAKGPGCH